MVEKPAILTSSVSDINKKQKRECARAFVILLLCGRRSRCRGDRRCGGASGAGGTSDGSTALCEQFRDFAVDLCDRLGVRARRVVVCNSRRGCRVRLFWLGGGVSAGRRQRAVERVVNVAVVLAEVLHQLGFCLELREARLAVELEEEALDE